MTKKVESFINKMFKMADGYLTEHQKMANANVGLDRLSRNMINVTFENFRKKKEAYA